MHDQTPDPPKDTASSDRSSLTWDERVPSWKALRALGQSRLANSAVLIPIIGYYILYGENFQQYLSLPAELEQGGDGHGPLHWFLTRDRTNMLYFGLCSIALGAVLFNLVCPPLVRDFRDYADYLARGEGERSLYTLSYVIGEIKKTKEFDWPWYRDWKDRIQTSFGAIFDAPHDEAELQKVLIPRTGTDRTLDATTLSSVVDAVMKMHYSVKSWSGFGLRISCTAFYTLGFLLVAASAVQVFFLVVLAAVG